VFFHKYAEFFLDLFGLEFVRLASSLALSLFLQSLSVSERVQGMVRTAHARTNAGQHNDLNFLARHEGITKDHCELALSKWNMRSLLSLTFLRVKGSNALFKSE